MLRKLFAASDTTGHGTLLDTSDVLTRHLASLMKDAETLVGRRLGPYRVLSLLGQGGMGSVWLAERADGLFARQVALKLVHPVLMGRHVTERFAREREILASLSHSHIARLFEAGFTDEGQPFLAMQYVAGEPITTYCDERQLGLHQRLQLFLQVLSAVQYAHTHLIIHRDLKPSNILVTDEGEAQLLDFGIAKLLTAGDARETELTQLGGRALTPDYASPEQIAGEPITTAADVYALGVILYELLTGERPYRLKRDSRGALEEAILRVEPVKPSQAASGSDPNASRRLRALRGDLDTIVLKALKKVPAERYATADALARDIQHYLRGQPVLAQPDTFWYRASKFVLRNRLGVGTAFGVLMLLGAALGAALEQAHRAREAARVSKSVESFLQDVFEANTKDQQNPMRAQQTTARELLEIGASKIDRALGDSPQAQLEVLETLVHMHHDLGLNEKAVELSRKRIALARVVFPPFDPRIAQALRDLSLDLPASRAASERPAVVREALAILDRSGDMSSLLRANLLGDLAQYYSEYDLPRALDYAQQSVVLLRRYPPSSDLKDGLELLGWIHTQSGGYAQAEPALLEAIQVSRASQGDPNAHLPSLYAYLAEAQYFLQDFPAAEHSYREGYRIARALEGEAHVDTLQLGARLGQFLCRTGRAQDGLQYLKEASAAVDKTRGSDDALDGPMIDELYGWELAQFGPIEPGLEILSTATAAWRKFRPGSDYMLSALERSAYVLVFQGRYAEAQALIDESTTIRERLHDETTYPNGNVVARVALLVALGRSDDAERVLARYRVQPKGPGGVSLSALDRTLTLAEISLSRGDFARARELSEQVTQDISGSSARRYLRRYEARSAVTRGLALLGLRDPGHALPLLRDAVQWQSELYDPQTNLLLAQSELALAQGLLAADKRTEARDALERAETIYARHPTLGVHLRTPLARLRAELRAERAANNR
jgi:serine/threonine-protein kinase